MKELLAEYTENQQIDILAIIKQHFDFETIHPFQDGNGRIGRMLMFRECLKNDIVPFIIDAEHKMFYYRGLQNYADVPGYLNDTCLSAQDQYQLVSKKFRIQTTKIEQSFDNNTISTLSESQLKKGIRALVIAGK